MNFFEHELRILFNESELLSADTVFTGKTAIGKIDRDVRAKLQFTATSAQNQYDAIKLTVINRNDGMIDSQLFRSSDIIGLKTENRRISGKITIKQVGTDINRPQENMRESAEQSTIIWQCMRVKTSSWTDKQCRKDGINEFI